MLDGHADTGAAAVHRRDLPLLEQVFGPTRDDLQGKDLGGWKGKDGPYAAMVGGAVHHGSPNGEATEATVVAQECQAHGSGWSLGTWSTFCPENG